MRIPRKSNEFIAASDGHTIEIMRANAVDRIRQLTMLHKFSAQQMFERVCEIIEIELVAENAIHRMSHMTDNVFCSDEMRQHQRVMWERERLDKINKANERAFSRNQQFIDEPKLAEE